MVWNQGGILLYLYFIMNLIGIVVVFAIAYISSINRKRIDFISVIVMLVIQLIITWFMISTKVGGDIIQLVAKFFLWLIHCSMSGIHFVFGDLAPLQGPAPFLIGVLMP